MLDVMLTVSLLLAAALLAFALATYAFFWYETANSHYREQLDELSQGKTRLWITRGIVSGLMSLFLVVISFPFGFCRKRWHPQPDPDCALPPVILLHGLYHNASAWIFYRYWLKRRGFKNVYALSYNSWKHSFASLLQRLDRLVAEVSDALSGKPVILIGHSLGGLLCRAYAERAEDAGKVAAVITLGAPHQGSKLAVLSLGKLAQSLVYRGPIIQQLEQAPPMSGCPRLAVYSPVDNIVFPNQALRVPYPGWEHRESTPISHVSLLFHYPTFGQVIEFIMQCGKPGRPE